jgi:hypothetical protein
LAKTSRDDGVNGGDGGKLVQACRKGIIVPAIA